MELEFSGNPLTVVEIAAFSGLKKNLKIMRIIDSWITNISEVFDEFVALTEINLQITA